MAKLTHLWGLAGLMVVGFSVSALAQEAGEDDSPSGRLPAYFRDVVSEEQKEQIYAIQAKYREQTEPLEKQLKQLQQAEDAEIEAVLTDKQKKKIAILAEMGKEFREKFNAYKKLAIERAMKELEAVDEQE